MKDAIDAVVEKDSKNKESTTFHVVIIDPVKPIPVKVPETIPLPATDIPVKK